MSYENTVLFSNKDFYTITEIAKDFGLTAVKLNAILGELNIQFKDKQTNKWEVYPRYIGSLVIAKKIDVVTSYGTKVVYQYLWTKEGKIKIYRILKQKGINPLNVRL